MFVHSKEAVGLKLGSFFAMFSACNETKLKDGKRQTNQRIDSHERIVVECCETFHHYSLVKGWIWNDKQ